MNGRLSLCGILVLLGFAQSATATLLDSISHSGGVSVQNSAETKLSALLAIGNVSQLCFNAGNCPKVALLQGIDASSIGTIIAIDSGSSNFAALMAALSTGGEYIWTGVVPGPSYGTSSGGAAGYPVPDFSGDTISSLVLTIDSVVIGPAPIPPGTTEFLLSYTLDVFGDPATPEPSTWLSALIGFCALIALKRHKHRRATHSTSTG